MTTAITTLLAKLGKPLRADVGKSPNGAYHLVEAQDGDRYARVMVEANCPPEQVARAVEAALTALCRGRV